MFRCIAFNTTFCATVMCFIGFQLMKHDEPWHALLLGFAGLILAIVTGGMFFENVRRGRHYRKSRISRMLEAVPVLPEASFVYKGEAEDVVAGVSTYDHWS